MTTAKYLKRLEWLENTIRSRAERIEVDRGRATNMVAPTDHEPVQTSPRDALCEILSGVVDMDNVLQGYVGEYKYIMAQVDSLSGKYSPAYIYLRFAKDKKMHEIAERLEISRTTAYRVQREALAEFEELYGETYKCANNYQSLAHFGTF